jgi:hypothetical protein
MANEIDVIEAGADGCVIAGVDEMRGLFAVHRAETGTDAGYYIGPVGSGLDDIEDCHCFEVSGVGAGSRRDVADRLLHARRRNRPMEL